MNKQPEITWATKNRITDAFFTIYEKTPINKIRIIDITKTAGCNRSTFYEYFKDIYDILEFGEERIIEDIVSSANKESDQSDAELLPTIQQVYLRNGKNICILLGENGDSRFLQRFKDALYQKFLSAQQIQDNAVSELSYEYSLTGLIMSFRWWYLHQDTCSMEEFLKIMQSLITQGTLNTLK